MPLSGDLARYRLIEPIGRGGGYGVPWRAMRHDGLACVVKLIQGFHDPTPAELARLEQVLVRLEFVESEHVVPIIDSGVSQEPVGRLPWVAMEELPGARSLDQVIRAHDGPLGSAHAFAIGRDIARGLADLHAAMALHRDLKPANVLIDAAGRARLIDFELLKVLDVVTRTSRREEPLGTVVFMAPEQLFGPVVPQTDLWALGLILLELLTGRQPVLEAARRGADVRRALSSSSLVPASLASPWDELIPHLLRKIPAERPESAERVVRWLTEPDPALLRRAPREITPPVRWELRSEDDVRGAELAARGSIRVAAVDVAPHLARRLPWLLAHVQQLGARLALETGEAGDPAQLSFDAAVPDDLDEVERDVLAELARRVEYPGDEVLLPWRSLDQGDAGRAVEALRIGLSHGHMAEGRRLTGTVEVPAGVIVRPRDALPFAAALSALEPDGWRLLVAGLEPGVSADVIAATAEFAAMLGARADVWVRAPGIHRWAMAVSPGVSVLYRAGRGLWTRAGRVTGTVPPERIEIAALAGPVPREIAERIEIAAPHLLACDCPAHGRGRVLPRSGAATILHNVHVVARQLEELQALDVRLRPARGAATLEVARSTRAALATLIEWHGELDDVDAVLCAITAPDRARRGSTPLRQLA